MTSTAAASSDVLALLAKHGFAPTSSSLDVDVRKPHPSQAKVRREMLRFNVADCGRRYGKTFLGTDWDLEPAVNPQAFLVNSTQSVRDFVKAKRMGGLPVAWFAPTFKMLAEVWDEMVKIIGHDNIIRKNQQQGRLELKNGGKIDFWSLEAAPTLRGRFYARAVIDEAAHVSCDLQKVWEKVIRPTLSDLQGEAFFISTPDGYNFFRTLYERGEDPNYPEWKSWQLPTSDNPFIDPKEIETAREEMDDQSFRQEYLAEFLRDEGKVFRNVEANLIAPAGSTPQAHYGHKMVAGVDWAQVKDFTVDSVACATCKQEVLLNRFNQIEFHTQRQKLIEDWKTWNVRTAIVEENSIGRPNYEELLRETIYTQDGGICKVRAVKLTSASKPKLVQRLALSLEKQQFQFLPDRVGQNELLSYEAKVNPNTGNIIYTAPSGAHDDTVVARFIMLSNIHSGGVARLQPFRLR
jgi:hypothetical protein